MRITKENQYKTGISSGALAHYLTKIMQEEGLNITKARIFFELMAIYEHQSGLFLPVDWERIKQGVYNCAKFN